MCFANEKKKKKCYRRFLSIVFIILNDIQISDNIAVQKKDQYRGFVWCPTPMLISGKNQKVSTKRKCFFFGGGNKEELCFFDKKIFFYFLKKMFFGELFFRENFKKILIIFLWTEN